MSAKKKKYPLLKKPSEWSKEYLIQICDSDGWRDKDIKIPVTRKEFLHRVSRCTIIGDLSKAIKAGKRKEKMQLKRDDPLKRDCAIIVKQKTYRSTGKVNEDDDRVRVTLDMDRKLWKTIKPNLRLYNNGG